MDSLCEMMDLVTQVNLPVVLMGDFNCNMLKFESHTISLGNLMSEYDLQQLIVDPTKITQSSSTLIDLLLCSDSNLFAESGCKDLCNIDHCMIYGKFKMKPTLSKSCIRTVRCFSRCNVEKLLECSLELDG